MNYTVCKGQGCGQKIGFLRIEKTWNVMPVDPTPVIEWLAIDQASGWGPRVTLIVEIPGGLGEIVTGQRGNVPADGTVEEIRKATVGLKQIVGHVPHWATCPAHNLFRTKPRRTAPASTE